MERERGFEQDPRDIEVIPDAGMRLLMEEVNVHLSQFEPDEAVNAVEFLKYSDMLPASVNKSPAGKIRELVTRFGKRNFFEIEARGGYRKQKEYLMRHDDLRAFTALLYTYEANNQVYKNISERQDIYDAKNALGEYYLADRFDLHEEVVVPFTVSRKIVSSSEGPTDEEIVKDGLYHKLLHIDDKFHPDSGTQITREELVQSKRSIEESNPLNLDVLNVPMDQKHTGLDYQELLMVDLLFSVGRRDPYSFSLDPNEKGYRGLVVALECASEMLRQKDEQREEGMEKTTLKELAYEYRDKILEKLK